MVTNDYESKKKLAKEFSKKFKSSTQLQDYLFYTKYNYYSS